MALPPNLNQEELSEAALAIFGLTAFRVVTQVPRYAVPGFVMTERGG